MRAERWVEGLRFGECPRWHAGRWWLSDFYDHAVKTIDAEGHVDTVVEVPGRPAGLGWLPDGRLLVVSMTDRRLLRREDDGRLVEHADLSGVATFHCNDLVVDANGTAWVGHFGFDLQTELERRGVPSVVAEHPKARLARVAPDGTVSAAAPELSFPNGLALDGAGRLLVAETIAFRITAFDVDGTELVGRRVFAACGDRAPDGICLDAAGGVWFANALGPECVRVDAQGAVTDVVETDARCFGCMLGGEDGRTLLMVGSETDHEAEASIQRVSRVWTARVAVPHAGRP